MATVMVSPIHFEDFSGIQFERLVLHTMCVLVGAI
jgi:hypothetical protein